MGSGVTKHVDLSEVVEEDWSEFMVVDLKIQQSAVFSNATFWHCKDGICKETMP